MLISCNNKGCLKGSSALLKEDTMEVICQECGLPITNISDSMKRALKSFGQIVRSNERKASLLHCRSCRANRDIVLDQNNNTVCKICYSPITITPAFKMTMEEAGSGFERIDTSKQKTTKK
ncbi:hypothetical protein LCGC14_0964310 [marine sediment metagenome]|uniref:Uncharacterized protein n=1 Tax=marine sediment metagenome TaxID=412755 RepID=A0A0F9RK39_9ZZZZ